MKAASATPTPWYRSALPMVLAAVALVAADARADDSERNGKQNEVQD